jgi:protein SCO1/2
MTSKLHLPTCSLLLPLALLGATTLGCDQAPSEKANHEAGKQEAAAESAAARKSATDETALRGHDAAKAAKDPHAHHRHQAGLELPADTPPSGASLCHIESTFTTQAGKELKFKEFAGKPIVLAMVYTHCEHACPMIVADMKAIEKGLSEEQRKGVHFVLASMDPDRDTVERLSAFSKQASLDASRWTLLRSDAGSVRELAAVLGVKYRPEPPSDFAHSNIITVLDAGGVIVHRQEGLGAQPQDSIAALSGQLAQKAAGAAPK